MHHQTAASGPQPSPLLQVDVVRERGTIRIAPVGELDLNTLPLLQEALAQADTAGIERVVVDLSELTFMDSTGIYLLRGLAAKSRDAGRELSVVRGPWQVQRIFQLAGVEPEFAFSDGAPAL